ncbi:MAG: hypothetical protein DRI95_10005 [Bacteroidetes bacterium]|nr:MAG: hypothetical protein DRI95_10005 [Bacteroidota bacterium]RLD84526.1 MAG: hypothetical protein DRJ07_04855 [Bacteroidota bacterium]
MKKAFIFLLLCFYAISCNQNNSFNEGEYLKNGKEIYQLTGKTLVGKVKKAIKEDGPFGAIDFCKLKAYPLTDSLSKLYQAEITRVAIKYRNLNSKANKQEEKVINDYIKQLSQNIELKPIVIAEKEIIHYYAPIKVEHACLTCHGNPGSNIPDTLYNHIKNLYPDDIAIDFKEGDIRGIWRIRFKSNL